MNRKDAFTIACRREPIGDSLVSPSEQNRFPDTVSYLGNLVRILLTSRDTGGRLTLLHSIERRGCEPPVHRHRNEDEIVYVLKGEITYYVDEEPHRVLTGSSLLLPRGGEHCYRVESGEAHLLTIVTPSGLEGYYAELDGRQSFETLVTVAARYGVEITGPLLDDRGAGEVEEAIW